MELYQSLAIFKDEKHILDPTRFEDASAKLGTAGSARQSHRTERKADCRLDAPASMNGLWIVHCGVSYTS